METDALKRYSAAEVILLAIFALGLALSLMLVKIRGRVDLDEPVRLPLAGLAAPLPAGENWETAGGWRYESDNAFVLLGRMRIRGRVFMNVRWRYALCDEPMAPHDLLFQRAEAVGGHLQPLGTAPGVIAMQYGRIYTPTRTGEQFLIGSAALDFGRRLELHISYLSDPDFAENAFRALAAAAVYEQPDPLAAGAAHVERFTDERLALQFNNAPQSDSAFLLKDTAQRPQGYAIRRFFVYDDDEDGHHRLTTRRLDASGAYSESDLWVTDADGAFSWTTQTWTPRSTQPRTAELRADTAGRIVLRANTDRRLSLHRTPMMLPDVFLSEFAAELLDTGDVELIVDILTGSGRVVPTRIAVIDPEKSPIRSEQTVRIVRAEYLHADANFDDFVFDAAGRLLGRFEQEPRRPGLLWDPSTQQQLQQIFGERFEPRARQAVWLH